METKVFISQPMRNKSKNYIDRERRLILDILPSISGEDNLLEIPMIGDLAMSTNKPAACLGMSIQDLSNADLVAFAPGWRDARGCVVEHAVCMLYNIPYIELANDGNGYFIAKDGRGGITVNA